MVTETKKAKRARWKKGLRRKRDSIFRCVFLQLQTGPCYHDTPYHRDHSTLLRGRQK